MTSYQRVFISKKWIKTLYIISNHNMINYLETESWSNYSAEWSINGRLKEYFHMRFQAKSMHCLKDYSNDQIMYIHIYLYLTYADQGQKENKPSKICHSVQSKIKNMIKFRLKTKLKPRKRKRNHLPSWNSEDSRTHWSWHIQTRP